MTTIWSGTIDREHVRAQQRPAPAPTQADTQSGTANDVVLRTLRLHGPATSAELQRRTGLDVYRVSTATSRLRRRRLIEMTRRPDVRRPVYVAVSR